MLPRVSVIIPCLNHAEALAETLDNVCKQEYANLEIIVVDGDSSDDTQKVIQHFADRIHWWCSEPDYGISDAFNKGVKAATGDYLYFLGVGDTFASVYVLGQLLEGVRAPYPLVCGQVCQVDEHNRVHAMAPKKLPHPFRAQFLKFRMRLPHQGLLVPRWFFEKYGEFSILYRTAMDYEHLLRAYHKFPPLLFKPVLVANWRMGGVSSNAVKVHGEYLKAQLAHQVVAPWKAYLNYLVMRLRIGLKKVLV